MTQFQNGDTIRYKDAIHALKIDLENGDQSKQFKVTPNKTNRSHTTDKLDYHTPEEQGQVSSEIKPLNKTFFTKDQTSLEVPSYNTSRFVNDGRKKYQDRGAHMSCIKEYDIITNTNPMN